MTAIRVAKRAIRRAVLGILRALPRRLVFRLLGLPAGTAELRSLQQIPVYGSTSKLIPAPGTVEEAIHTSFVPGSEPDHRVSGWLFERSFVVPVRRGISRSTGFSFTPSGHLIDLGPGITPRRGEDQCFYRPLSRVPHVDDSVATLTTFWDSNYFHWLFDVLPRVRLVELAGLKPRWIYASLRHAFQRDTLLQLGYPPDMIIDAAAVPQISAAELIFPSLPGIPGVMHEWVCTFLRDRLSPETTTYHGDRRRIYISRAGARSRRIVNESHVLDVLASYGFTVVRPETLSFAEQVRLFQSAECVVAPHGGGLANIVFCPSGGSVIEILPPERMVLCYWVLSHQVSLRYHYLLASAGSHGQDMEVDLDKLERTIDAALGPSAARPSWRAGSLSASSSHAR